MGEPAFEGWAKLELMGHRQMAGYVREVEMYGGKFCRIDTPALEATPADPRSYRSAQPAMAPQTQFYGEKAIYCVTPCSEQVARNIAARIRHEAVSTFDQGPLFIEAASAASEEVDEDDDAPDESDDEDLEMQDERQRMAEAGRIGPPRMWDADPAPEGDAPTRAPEVEPAP